MIKKIAKAKPRPLINQFNRASRNHGLKFELARSESGSSTTEFLSAFTLGIVIAGFVAWITWILCLKVHVENIAARAASILSHDSLLAYHQGRELRVDFVKSWSKETLELFPFVNALSSQGMDNRMRVLSGEHLGQNAHVSIHLCIPKRSQFTQTVKSTPRSADSRDCLGQWSHMNQTSNSWLRVDSMHLAHSSHRIYTDGLSGLPDTQRRTEINARLLRKAGDFQWD